MKEFKKGQVVKVWLEDVVLVEGGVWCYGVIDQKYYNKELVGFDTLIWREFSPCISTNPDDGLTLEELQKYKTELILYSQTKLLN